MTSRKADRDAVLVSLITMQGFPIASSICAWQATCTSSLYFNCVRQRALEFQSLDHDLNDQTVLVFGPTGAVGCTATIETHRRGARGALVGLAVRDMEKSIRGLSDYDLTSERYQRIQADLSKPDALKQAA